MAISQVNAAPALKMEERRLESKANEISREPKICANAFEKLILAPERISEWELRELLDDALEHLRKQHQRDVARDQIRTIEIRSSKFVVLPETMSMDNYPRFNYTGHDKILFLSDAGKAGRALSKLKKDPTKLVVSSDYSYAPGVNVKLDNNHLPFKDDSFDLVVMNRGICPCHDCVSCGGINTEKSAMTNFLQQTVNVLDKSNPKSLALITAYFGRTGFGRRAPAIWLTILEEFKAKYPNLQFAVVHSGVFDGESVSEFGGIAISADTKVPIEQRIVELHP